MSCWTAAVRQTVEAISSVKAAAWFVLVTSLIVSIPLTACSRITSDISSVVQKIPPAWRFSSLAKDIQSLLEKQQFAEARRRLEEVQAGEKPSPDFPKDERRIAARAAFQKGVEDYFLSAAAELLRSGHPRAAAERLDGGLVVCPWCQALGAKHEQITDLVRQIDTLRDVVDRALLSHPQDWRTALDQTKTLRGSLRDSPQIARAAAELEKKLSERTPRSSDNCGGFFRCHRQDKGYGEDFYQSFRRTDRARYRAVFARSFAETESETAY